jgi:hypothetical protein
MGFEREGQDAEARRTLNVDVRQAFQFRAPRHAGASNDVNTAW